MVGYAIRPESETVLGDVTWFTPLPGANATSSAGCPLQAKSNGLVGGTTVGIAGVSLPPDPSQRGTSAVLRSFGNVTVCGSCRSRGRQTTVSPGLIVTFRGSISRTATWPSGSEVPTWSVQVLVPFVLTFTAALSAAVLVTLSGRWGRILGATPAGPLRPQGSRGDLAPPMEPRPVPSSTGQGPRSDTGLRAGAGIGTRVLVAGLVAGLGALGLALIAAGPGSAGGGSAGTAAVLLVLASYGSVAVILALRRPRNPLGWIFFGVLAIVELTTLAESLGGTGVLAGAPLPGGLANVLIWFESWGFALLFALFFAVTLVFPSGHLPARRAGRAARAALGAIPVGLAVIAFGPELGGVYGEAHVRNPFGVLPISDRVWVIPY